MEEAVSGLISDFMLNLDKVAASELEDRRTKRAVVPWSLRGQTIHHGVNRNLKQVAIVTCMAASGEPLIPYVLISQDSRSVHMDLKSTVLSLEGI
jgi:hypothetical protein